MKKLLVIFCLLFANCSQKTECVGKYKIGDLVKVKGSEKHVAVENITCHSYIVYGIIEETNAGFKSKVVREELLTK